MFRAWFKRLFRKEYSPIVPEAISEIRNASLSIHGALESLSSKRGPKAQVEVILSIAMENRRIQNALNFLKKEGL